MGIIDRNPKDLKLANKCIECRCTLPEHHPHHWLCQWCWEKKQEAKGHLGIVLISNMLRKRGR